MKAGLTTSVVMHAALLGFGLISLSSPRPMDSADMEALPVDIVPVEELTQLQEGDKKAPVSEKPAPTPTERPDVVADAKQIGDNELDTNNPITEGDKPKPVKTAEERAPSPKPVEKVKPLEEPKPQEEPKPVPATEVAPTPAPREEVKPEPVKEAAAEPTPDKSEPKPVEEPVKTAAIEPPKPDAISEAITDSAEAPAEETVKLPDAAPAPAARPKPAEAQTAKAPERKETEKPVKEAAAKPQSDETGSIEDDIAAVLDKEKAKGGGAKRSTQTAALGGKKTTGTKLSQGEMDALRGQLIQCWNPPVGMEDGAGLRASIRFNVDSSGKMSGAPGLETSSGNTQFDESAMRAIRKCDAQGLNLPAGKSDIWSEIVVNFDPSEMY